MNRQILYTSVLALALMGGTAGLLSKLGSREMLAPPGVKTHAIPGSIRLEADLPEQVLDYKSQPIKVDDVTLGTLPQDTSFGMRSYHAPDGFVVDLRVVLMGRDRTSLHKPQLCLTGQGWHINDFASAETSVPVARPFNYDLPVVKLIANSVNNQNQPVSGLYVYWYVAEDGLSASTSGFQRMWSMATKLLKTGVLQRWAYVSCFSECAPGQENATFERMKPFIAAAVPEFQLFPRQPSVAVAATE